MRERPRQIVYTTTICESRETTRSVLRRDSGRTRERTFTASRSGEN